VNPEPGYHFVDLWQHRLLTPVKKDDDWWITAETEAFHKNTLAPTMKEK